MTTTATAPKSTKATSTEIRFNRAINAYVELTLKAQKLAYLTEPQVEFVSYIDKNCYYGYPGGRRPRSEEGIGEYQAEILAKYDALFV